MRPLYHPSLEEITVQGILHALSDPVRVRIYGELVGAECAMNCTAFLWQLEASQVNLVATFQDPSGSWFDSQRTPGR
jgi:hypothetical protein